MSVILAVLDERERIDGVLDALEDQTYEGALEIVVADGGSQDGTRERLEERARLDPRVIVIDNPDRRQSPGLNLAAGAASGAYLVRADGHTTYDADYISRSITALLETNAVAVGGPMNPVCASGFGAAVAGAMNSPMVLPAPFHHATKRAEVDTVYLGAFRRSDYLEIGGFRAFPSGTSEDADFYARWRARGRTVLVDPSIRSEYGPRRSPGAVWKQFFRYGQGKSEMLWANRRYPSLRPLAPALLVIGLIALTLAGLATQAWWPVGLLALAWATWLAIVGFRSPAPTYRVMVAAGIMHLSYGIGLLWGLVRGPGPVRRGLDA